MRKYRWVLKNIFFFYLSKIDSLAVKNRILKGSKVVLYHAFGDQRVTDPELDYGLTVDYQLFFDQINSVPRGVFAKSLEEFDDSMRCGRDMLLVSMDDGYSSTRVASDWLTDRHIFHVVFVISDLIGTDGYLSDDDLLAMHLGGFCEVGSHTIDHSNLADADAVELQRQIVNSKVDIERLLGGNSVRCFSLPFGSGGPRAIEEALKSYRYVFTSLHGSNDESSLKKGIRRIEIVAGDSIDRFWLKIRGGYDWIFQLDSFFGARR